jgi:hypothetical protein
VAHKSWPAVAGSRAGRHHDCSNLDYLRYSMAAVWHRRSY